MTIAGIEVQLSVSPGPLETLVAGRYVPYLGASEVPCCEIRLEPTEGAHHPERDNAALVERTAEGAYLLANPGFFGVFDPTGAGTLSCASTPIAVDDALRLVFALLAPHHAAMMLHAAGVIGADGAHVFAPPNSSGESAAVGSAGHRPVLTDGYLILRRIDGDWFAAATPFWTSHCQPGQSRESRMARLWGLLPSQDHATTSVGIESAVRTLMENAVLPCADAEIRQLARELARDLAFAVPSSEMPRTSSAVVWREIEASHA